MVKIKRNYRGGSKSKSKSNVNDGYINPLTRTGRHQRNLSSGSGYNYNTVTRDRAILDSIYRGSWVIGNAVDCVADDMTRAGIDILGLDDPNELAAIQSQISNLNIWASIGETIKWARLYGGSIGILMIDGQNPETPLNIETVGKDQFKGIFPLDRWVVNPNLIQTVHKFGGNYGYPEWYDILPSFEQISGGWVYAGRKVHYTRVIRMDGIKLPPYSRQTENGWGMSVVERAFDILTAFDSATLGAAQLVYQARLRTLKLNNLSEVIGSGNKKAVEGLYKRLEYIRSMQSNEGLTCLDAKDEFEVSTYAFTGLDSILMQFSAQLSGAFQIPLTRLMGQSPSGFATGESEIRQYQEGIAQRQEGYRGAVHNILKLLYQSTFGKAAPETLDFRFNSLWGLNEKEKAELASTRTNMVISAFECGLITRETALSELKAKSDEDGAWDTISPDLIEESKNDPPPIDENRTNLTSIPNHIMENNNEKTGQTKVQSI